MTKETVVQTIRQISIKRRVPVVLFYIALGLALITLGYLDTQRSSYPIWLGYISIVGGGLALTITLFKSLKVRSLLTTLVVFAMLTRLTSFLFDQRGTGNPFIGAQLFLTLVWMALIMALVALVSTDADLPSMAQEVRKRWAILNHRPKREAP